MEKKKVLVIGGGFGGVFAAKALERHGRGKLEVELVNANNYFVFQPLLPEVAASSIHSADAVVPLRQLLRRLQVRQAEVMGIDFAKKSVIVVQGTRRIPVDLAYDELVIALGTGVDLNRFPGLPEHALTMKDLADAHRLRTHVIGCLETADVTDEPEVKQQLLTFVVVGAGFSGVETVAEMRELVRRALKYYTNIKTDEIRFYLIEYADRILPTFPADLAEYATRRLQIHGIEVLTGVGTKSATGTAVELTDGRIIPTSTIVATIGNWAAPAGGGARPRHALGPHQDRPLHARAGPGRRVGAGRRSPHPAGRQPRRRPGPLCDADRAIRRARRAAAGRQHCRQDRGQGAQALRLYLERLARLARHEQGGGRRLWHQALGHARLAVVARVLSLVPAGLRRQIQGGRDLAA